MPVYKAIVSKEDEAKLKELFNLAKKKAYLSFDQEPAQKIGKKHQSIFMVHVTDRLSAKFEKEIKKTGLVRQLLKQKEDGTFTLAYY